ncbi:probable galacturonosyltransferase 7 isoform X2 [Impatiens glandulifera]|uniref:probable galacturonosyltransferase 7 isoform X2 n=1 Tax=Impatiens glandulifera TaxID=253017 RepID=UPI001FB1427B|nr:probable galacturonosyltransferase 7 isoform X2 [Impatiens glandulifera]
MKGGASSYSYTLPVKRRCRGLAIGLLGLALLSIFVPLVCLLGLHSSFYSVTGYVSDRNKTSSNVLIVSGQHEDGNTRNLSRRRDDDGNTISQTKDFTKVYENEDKDETTGSPVLTNSSEPHQKVPSFRGSPVAQHMEGSIDETESLCERKLGSYCLWRQQNTEKMEDNLVKRMKDLLFVARAYYPSIAKLPRHDKLSQEMKQSIQEFERILSDTTTDADLPQQMEGKIKRMESVISKAKSVIPMDSNNVEKKFRQLVDVTEDEANFHMKQSAFLYQLAVQTVAKSLHCLSMRLTTEYFKSPPPPNLEQLLAEKYTNPTLHHYVIFSNNVLASSVVVKSTVMHSKVSRDQVFHVLTDRQNYFAMKYWFHKYNYMEATVRVLNIEDLDPSTPLYLPEEFRISLNDIDKSKTTRARTEYISMFSRSHYLIPKLFHSLKKVVVLDDDIVIQRDLSALWGVDLEGKVNGAVQFCALRFSQLKSYLGETIKDGDSCAWMSGVNIVDLDRWRELNLTAIFQKLVKEKNNKGNLYQSPTLRASLLTFEGLVKALDATWVVSGLSHDYSLDKGVIKEASVLHFNGNMKPWIDMGIHKYRTYWTKFLDRENHLLNDCNVNP